MCVSFPFQPLQMKELFLRCQILHYRFSRNITGQDPYPQDVVLNQALYLEFGRGSGGRGKNIKHMSRE